MKNEAFNAHNKYMILRHALHESNVAKTCALFGISRTTFYNWRSIYQKHGMNGLESKEPQKPKMPNKVSKAIETEILDYVTRFPSDGPKQIFYELKSDGIFVGESGIYNVLKRHDLNTKAKRNAYAKDKAKSMHPRSQNTTSKASQSVDSIRSLEQNDKMGPGFLVVQRLDFIGHFAGIGKLYQYTLIDTCSKWVVVKLYHKKSDFDIWETFELKLDYLLRTLNLNITHLFTEKNKQFLHYFMPNDHLENMVKRYKISHRFVALKDAPSTSPMGDGLFDDLNDFQSMIHSQFYRQIASHSHLNTFEKVERALYRFVRHYNTTHVLDKGDHKGKTSAQVMLAEAIRNHVEVETLPLWLLVLLDPPLGFEPTATSNPLLGGDKDD